jgi:uncharacterized protein YndB with AHSA1/START domain
VPTARRTRTIDAPLEELWEVVRDPHHLPRWWPRVNRVEGVAGDAFTEVMTTAKGRVVRADFNVVLADRAAGTLRWAQSVQGTPFARVLSSAETEVRLARADGAEGPPSLSRESRPRTEVTIELRQVLTGFFPRFGGFLVRRAAAETIDQALDGLERISA